VRAAANPLGIAVWQIAFDPDLERAERSARALRSAQRLRARRVLWGAVA
jgi:hypothetical protein